MKDYIKEGLNIFSFIIGTLIVFITRLIMIIPHYFFDCCDIMCKRKFVYKLPKYIKCSIFAISSVLFNTITCKTNKSYNYFYNYYKSKK